jgi:hypothetical protein
MKRLPVRILLCLFAGIIASAAPAAPSPPPPSAGHFPLAAGMRWTYESNLGEVSSWVEASGDECRVLATSSTLDTEQRLRLSAEGVYLLSAKSKVCFFGTERVYEPPLLRLPLPLAVGKTWNWSGKETADGDEITTSVTGTVEAEEKVSVPAGEYSCLRVKVDTSCSDGTTASSTQWLAPGIGIVKADIAVDAVGFSGFLISLIGMDRFTLELKEMKKN